MKRRCQIIAALVLALGLGTASAQPIRVGGLVVGPGDEMVEGVRVRLETYGDRHDRALRRLAGLSGSGETVAETTLDAAGLFRLDAPHAGMWRVLVEAPGYRTMEYRLRPLCEPRDLPALELEPAVAVEVRAVDVAGRPVAAAVALYDSEGGRHWRRRFQIDHTREDGVARFERAGGEQVRYVASPLGPSSDLALVRGDAEGGEIVLAQGVPGILSVHDAANAPVADAVVYQGNDLLPLGTTDARGRLAIAHAQDNPEVWVLAADGSSGRFEIDLGPGAAGVRLAPAARRSGRVVEEGSGEPIADAFVLPSYSRAGRSDLRGQFSIDVPVIETGRTWTAAAAGYGSVRKREGERPESLDFQLPRAAVLRGSVVDAEGRPVSGGDVRADPLSRADDRIVRRFPRPPGGSRARTAGDGRFAVHGLAPGASYEVVAEREGTAPGRGEVYALGPSSPALRLVLGPGLRASGRVIGDGGRPVAGAAVKLLRSPPGTEAETRRGVPLRPDRREPRSFATDAEGRFTAVDLGAGRHDLEVQADGYTTARYPGIEIPAEDAGGEIDLGTFVLERGATIAGRVVDADGQGVAGARVRSRAVGEYVGRDEMETQADGGFALAGLRPGEERVVEADLKGFAPSAALAVARREDGGETEPLLIVLRPPGTISGRVVAGEGRPVAGASVSAPPDERSLLRHRGAQIFETDAAGRFEIVDVPAGTVDLQVRAEGYRMEMLPGLSAPPGGELTGVEIVLRPGVSIRGRVTRADGTPVAAEVSAELREDGATARGRTDAEGHYEMGMALPPGWIRVSVRDTNVARTVDGRRGGVFTVDLVLAAGAEVSGRVVDETGRGLAGALLKLIAADGFLFFDEAGPRSDAGGAFAVSGVQPGTYRLYARKDGFATAESEAFHVEDGPVAGVRLVMRRGATLRGNVLGLEVAELAELSVEARGSPSPDSERTRAPSASMRQRGTVDHDGSYRIPALVPGFWSVSASLPEHRLRELVVVAEGDAEVHRDLDFSSRSTLRGTLLVSRPGQPLAPAPGFQVRAWSLAGGSSSRDRTDAAGRFRLEGIRQDTDLHVSLRLGWTAYSRQVDLAAGGEVILELHLANLRGQVLDASTLLPVPDAHSKLEAVPGTTSVWSYSTRSVSDVRGRFEVEGIPAARWRLVVSRPGYAQESVAVDLSSGADLDGLEILLVPSEDITFQAVDEGGEAPRRLMASVFRPDGSTVVAELLRPDEHGTFRLSTVPRGAGLLNVSDFGDSSSVATTAFASPGDLGRLVLRRGGFARLRVPELEGGEVFAWIRAVGGNGQPFYSPDSASFRDAGRIEVGSWPMQGGVGHVGSLVPGLWSFTVTAGDGRTWSAQAKVVTGETVEVVLR